MAKNKENLPIDWNLIVDTGMAIGNFFINIIRKLGGSMCKCIMHLLSHHAPTGVWYFVDTISNSIIVIVCISGMRPYRRIPR